MASDLDGAVYIADDNVIRRLSPDTKTVKSILELRLVHRFTDSQL